MSTLISPEKIQEAMEWAYEKAVNGVGMGTAIELAEDYMQSSESSEEQINSLIRWQNTKAGSAGFVTGLGGVITLPVTIPANVLSTLYIQIRMIAAIAHIAGHDIKNDKVQTLIYLCLVGNSLNEVAKDTGIMIGTKFTKSFIEKKVSGEALKKINQAVGFRLVTKAGSTGVINLTKLVPILGGVVAGGFDVFTTNVIGNTARNTFLGLSPKDLSM